MEKTIYKVLSNRRIAKDVFEMKLSGSVKDFTAPGQFIDIGLEGLYLRRPISVCDIENKADGEGVVTIIYKVVGKGTEKMSGLKEESELSVLTALGNGFNTSKAAKKALIVGGGVGVPPMYGTARRLIAEGKNVTAVLGFNSSEDVFYEDEFRRLGARVIITTVDGSYGQKGFVTDAVMRFTAENKEGFDYTFACARSLC